MIMKKEYIKPSVESINCRAYTNCYQAVIDKIQMSKNQMTG